ncbi:MAG: hypothetical protein EAZ55_11230 [Cytophagales bacterium]|nr:MAG: hypothetical protein EAZ55_11230 [Cytophagales bacterium]
MKNIALLLLSLFLLCINNPILAQDNHYWSQQFGARSALMGGAVVGSVRDNSAVYYNPAAVSMIEFPSISVTANVYKYDIFSMRNGAGRGINLNSERLSLFPQLISGVRSFKNNNVLKWGYALLTRHQANLFIDQRHETFYDVMSGLSGLEEFIGIFQYRSSMNELWGGLTLSWRPKKNWAIGVTQFFTYRNQNYINLAERTCIPANITQSTYFVATANNNASVLINHFGMVWKLGIAYDSPHWKAGVTVTSPSVTIYGSGKVDREISSNFVGTYLSPNTAPNFTATAEQSNNHLTFKSPLSVAFGLEYTHKKTHVSFALEYFNSMTGYRIISSDKSAFFRPSTLNESILGQNWNATEFLSVTTQAIEVWNFAIGIEQGLSEKVNLLLGFRTDRDAYGRRNSDPRTISLAPTAWDLFHASAGVSFKKGRDVVTLGVNFAFSESKSNRQFISYSDPKDTRLLLGIADNTADISNQAYNLIVGFTRFLQKENPNNSKE